MGKVRKGGKVEEWVSEGVEEWKSGKAATNQTTKQSNNTLFVSFRAPRRRRFVFGEAKRPAGLAMEGLRRPTKSRQGAKPDSAKPTQVGSSPRRLSCSARQRLPPPSILSILSILSLGLNADPCRPSPPQPTRRSSPRGRHTCLCTLTVL